MSTKLTPGRAALLSTALLFFVPGCSIEDFDVDGDGQVTRAELLYGGFLWLCEDISGTEEPPEEPEPEEPAPEEPAPEEPAPDDGGETPVPDPTDPAAPF